MPFEDLSVASKSPLDDRAFRNQLTDSMCVDIDDGCVSLEESRYGNRIPMSQIGEPCARKLWYGYRWAHKETHEGRMLRLFDRGNLEEGRFIKWLETAGFEVQAFDKDGKQFEVTNCHGNFVGKLDAKLKLPKKYNVHEWMLGEFKTWKQDGQWSKLKKEGVRAIKPMHYTQMCVYGYHAELRYALYLAINKNNDAIHLEIVPLNWQIAEDMVRKAESIIEATPDAPPKKVSMTPSYFSCKWCHFNEICHENAPVDKNCRSCIQAESRPNQEWYCNGWKDIIPLETLKVGCEYHDPIKQQFGG